MMYYMIRRAIQIGLCGLVVGGLEAGYAQQHPRLFITAAEAAAIRQAIGHYALLDTTLGQVRVEVEAALSHPMDVPPPGEAGGYAHERHKQNYRDMYKAGLLFQITGDARYARFVRDMLMAYAAMYPELGPHPRSERQVPGKLFHQLLNECVWLVHTVIAYDAIYNWLSEEERAHIETSVLRPMASWIVNEGAREFDKIHNHGIWAVAAVGMTGYVIEEPEWVEKALYGTKKDGSAGFFAQLDQLFSPDGYYVEGPYYARYALWPLFFFAEAIERNEPERGIYAYRDSILKKALYATVQTTFPDGVFPPINDASLTMNVKAPGVVLGTNVVFARYGGDAALLGVVREQGQVILNGAGLAVAKAYAEAAAVPQMTWPSIEFTDGADGKRGGIGLLRAGTGRQQTVVLMKYGAHGMGHGHFDKLHFMLYDGGRQVIRDYGFARFINVEPKYGGRYLPENNSYAKQTIAHNTVVVDEISQNRADPKIAETLSGERHFFDGKGPVQAMSARANGYWPGVNMQRTLLLIEDSRLDYPVVVDLYRVVSDSTHQYDYPIHFLGQPIWTNVRLQSYTEQLRPLGADYGYQHIWKEAQARTDSVIQFTWLDGHRYYTWTVAAAPATQVILGRIGANDPHFNLRREPLILVRRWAKTHLFASVIEPHGYFHEAREVSLQARPQIKTVRVVGHNEAASVVEVVGKGGWRWTIMVTNGPDNPEARHTVTFGGRTFTWTGNYAVEGVAVASGSSFHD
ncbi:alginate lyase family protein [Rhodothermus profundi]|uniref:Alginate lyase n=1 Tax=Rhodothermus profundi TaxID=633813 RepID=A0A1M6SZT9_9BACT|nr:alginate lyase family protein [Rhodothermus profundi]SHK50180.1 Alginate lyase [Rhodothermus profundi]